MENIGARSCSLTMKGPPKQANVVRGITLYIITDYIGGRMAGNLPCEECYIMFIGISNIRHSDRAVDFDTYTILPKSSTTNCDKTDIGDK